MLTEKWIVLKEPLSNYSVSNKGYIKNNKTNKVLINRVSNKGFKEPIMVFKKVK